METMRPAWEGVWLGRWKTTMSRRTGHTTRKSKKESRVRATFRRLEELQQLQNSNNSTELVREMKLVYASSFGEEEDRWDRGGRSFPKADETILETSPPSPSLFSLPSFPRLRRQGSHSSVHLKPIQRSISSSHPTSSQNDEAEAEGGSKKEEGGGGKMRDLPFSPTVASWS